MIERKILYEITGRKHHDFDIDDEEDLKGKAFESESLSSDEDKSDHGGENLLKKRKTITNFMRKVADMDFAAINDD